MKKHLIVVLIFICVAWSAFLLTGCNSKDSANQYEINFVVDNNFYAKTNVSNGTIEKMPSDPQKEKYIFQGWYFDNNQWNKPLTQQAILDLPITNDKTINVYAYFVAYNCNADGKEHSLIETTSVKATCTQNGSKTYVCTACDYSYSQVIYATGHNCKKTITKEATCTENGTAHFVCENCGYAYNEKINAVGHNLGALVVTTSAKCKQDGEGYRHCSRCGEDIIESIPQTNHKLDSTKHCINDGCEYFEMFNCSVVVTSQFGTFTKDLSLEYGKPFYVSPESYGVEQLKFLGYYNGEEKVSDEKGNFNAVFQGQKSLSVTAKYYFAVTKADDLIALQDNSFLATYFTNQKHTEPLKVEIENEIDFKNVNWQPITINGYIDLNGKNHTLKNYYSTSGGLFTTVGKTYVNSTTIKNIIFETANLNIENLSADNVGKYSEMYTIGILASRITGAIEGITIKSGTIRVEYNGDLDLLVAGICGRVNSIINCTNHATITTNTAVAGGITVSADSVVGCKNYGIITTGDYIVSAMINSVYSNSYGTSGIVCEATSIERCINYANLTCKRLNIAGISITAKQITECSNFGDITATNGSAAGISYLCTNYDIEKACLDRCSNHGNITGIEYVAGIVCSSLGIANSYNVGDIISKTGYAGGIAVSYTNLVTMKYCYNDGTVKGKTGCFGGIVGKAQNVSLLKCINNDNNWASGTYNQTLCKVNDGTDNCFIELGYDSSIWQFNGNGKPMLKWETEYEA